MREQPPIICEQVFGSLKPLTRHSEEAIKGVKGRCVISITRMTRNQRRRSWYWVMLDTVAEVMADSTGTPWDAETLHDDLRDRLRLGTELVTPSGRKVWKRQSTSDKSMSEVDRAIWTSRVANYLSRQIGVEMHQLIDEVRNRGGGEMPDPSDATQQDKAA